MHVKKLKCTVTKSVLGRMLKKISKSKQTAPKKVKKTKEIRETAAAVFQCNWLFRGGPSALRLFIHGPLVHLFLTRWRR